MCATEKATRCRESLAGIRRGGSRQALLKGDAMERCIATSDNRPTRRRSFDGGVNYMDHGRVQGCECGACRAARHRSVREHVARELPAYMTGAHTA